MDALTGVLDMKKTRTVSDIIIENKFAVSRSEVRRFAVCGLLTRNGKKVTDAAEEVVEGDKVVFSRPKMQVIIDVEKE